MHTIHSNWLFSLPVLMKKYTTNAHLLQQIFRAQAEDLHVAVPVTHGKERRPHSVFGHFPHFQAGNLNPSQLLRADFLKCKR